MLFFHRTRARATRKMVAVGCFMVHGAKINFLVTFLRLIWASPATAIGLVIGLFGLMTHGQARRVGRTLEFHGGCVTWLLNCLRIEPLAITVGHVILGRSEASLDIARQHELVHVKQYERWGPFLIPAYLMCSLSLWVRKRDPYRENPFERAAYRDAS